jgi:hypothetical protein
VYQENWPDISIHLFVINKTKVCGPGMSTHGVFGNKSFTVEEKARFVLTLTYQEHDFDVHDSKVENKLVFEFGFTLNTIEDYLYQKENMWAISGYKCHNIYNVCLILTYPSQLNVNIHQSLWLGYEDSPCYRGRQNRAPDKLVLERI